MNGARRVLLDLLDEAFDHKSWHGTTLSGSLRGVGAAQAAKRPGPRRHNVWELVVHAAYWKYAVRRVLTGEKRRGFAFKGSNWFVRPGAQAERQDAFAADVRLLAEEHRKLRAAIAGLSERSLQERLPGRRYSAAHIIRGIAAHDLYHAGQIQMIKKLTR